MKTKFHTSYLLNRTSYLKYLLLAVCSLFISLAPAQEIQKELKPFTRIVVSPRINLILKKGDQESIRLVYSDVQEEKINIEVKGKTLSVYLDDAKITEKTERVWDNDNYQRRGIYAGASITAYVTYQELEHLEIRGNQELTCYDPIEADGFTLRAYGENEITLASLTTKYFKASLYGENKLRIRNGKAIEQRYKLYGENKIDTQDMKSHDTAMNIYGEGRYKINASDELRVNAFGEPDIYVKGGAHIHRRLIFGETTIRKN